MGDRLDEEMGEQSLPEGSGSVRVNGSVFQWESVTSGALSGLSWEQCYFISSVMTQTKGSSAPTADLHSKLSGVTLLKDVMLFRGTWTNSRSEPGEAS